MSGLELGLSLFGTAVVTALATALTFIKAYSNRVGGVITETGVLKSEFNNLKDKMEEMKLSLIHLSTLSSGIATSQILSQSNIANVNTKLDELVSRLNNGFRCSAHTDVVKDMAKYQCGK